MKHDVEHRPRQPQQAVRESIAEAALLRAAQRARETAHRFETPFYYLRDGKLVAEKV